jgi:hypothetical protein
MVRYIKKYPFPQAKKAHGKTVGISFWGCLWCSEKDHLKKVFIFDEILEENISTSK